MPKTAKAIPHSLQQSESFSWKVPLLVFGLVFAVYGLTMPRTVTFEDSGMFILSCKAMGISHPPGFPLYNIIGYFFSLLPFGSLALRIHIYSAVCGAASASVLWVLARRLRLSNPAAWIVAMGYAFSTTVWSQAIIAEVYSLHALLMFLTWGLALEYRNNESLTLLLATFFVFGLSLSNHLPLIILTGPTLLLLAAPNATSILRRAHWAMAAMILGLLPYAWMVFRSTQNPEISFYGPVDSLNKFMHFILRREYSDQPSSFVASDRSDAYRLLYGNLGSVIALQMTYVGMVLAALGFIRQWRTWGYTLGLSLLSATLCSSVLIIYLQSSYYSIIHAYSVSVFPMAAYGSMALWAGLGADWCFGFLTSKVSQPKMKRLSIAIAVGFTILVVTCNYRNNDRHNHDLAERYGTAVLQSLQDNSDYFVAYDVDLGPISYVSRALNVRQDVEVYHVQGRVFNNRLFTPPQEDSLAWSRIQEHMDMKHRATYSTTSQNLPYGIIDYGLFCQIRRDMSKHTVKYEVTPSILALYQHAADMGKSTDTWTNLFREITCYQGARVVQSILHHNRPDNAIELKALLNKIKNTMYGKLGAVKASIGITEPQILFDILTQVELEMQRHPLQIMPDKRAELHFLRARLAKELNDTASIVRELNLAVKAFPHPRKNTAVIELMNVYVQQSAFGKYEFMRRKFFPQDPPKTVLELDALVKKKR